MSLLLNFPLILHLLFFPDTTMKPLAAACVVRLKVSYLKIAAFISCNSILCKCKLSSDILFSSSICIRTLSLSSFSLAIASKFSRSCSIVASLVLWRLIEGLPSDTDDGLLSGEKLLSPRTELFFSSLMEKGEM